MYVYLHVCVGRYVRLYMYMNIHTYKYYRHTCAPVHVHISQYTHGVYVYVGVLAF